MLVDRYSKMEWSEVMKRVKTNKNGTFVMQGNVACAEGAIASGCNFFAGYPITPATEIAEHMAVRLMETGGYFVQMEDELGSISALVGASYAGARAMTATSGPGFSLMQEGIGAALCLERPMVLCDVMRGGPSSGQATAPSQMDIMQIKYGTHGDYEVIAICPASVQEAYDFTVRAFYIAYKYCIPVVVVMDEIVAHMREKIHIPEEVEIFDEKPERLYIGETFKIDENLIPPRINFFEGHRICADCNLHDETGHAAGNKFEVAAKCIRHLCDKVIKNSDDICSVEKYFDDEDVDVAVIAYGSVSRAANSAVEMARERGLKVSYMKVNTIWPLPVKEITEFCSKAQKVLVPEMNIGKYASEIQRIVGLDKVKGYSSLGGRFPNPDDILKCIEEMIEK